MKPGWVKQAANRAIEKLLLLARSDPARSKRYASLARKKSLKYKVAIDKTRHRICKKCGTLLVPGKNLRVRSASKPKKTIIMTCLDCGNKIRFPTGEKLKKRNPPKR